MGAETDGNGHQGIDGIGFGGDNGAEGQGGGIPSSAQQQPYPMNPPAQQPGYPMNPPAQQPPYPMNPPAQQPPYPMNPPAQQPPYPVGMPAQQYSQQPSSPAGGPVSQRNPAKTALKASLIAVPALVVLWFVACFVIGFVAWQMGPSEGMAWSESASAALGFAIGVLLSVDILAIVASGIAFLVTRH